MPEDQQGPFGREHIDTHTRQLGDMMSPDTTGVHDHLRIEVALLFRLVIIGLDTDDAVLLSDEAHYLMIDQGHRSVRTGIQHIGDGQPERINRTIGHHHRTRQSWIDGRLHVDRLLRINRVRIDTGLLATLDEGALIGQVIFRQRDEKPGGILHAMAGNLFQDFILFDALGGRLIVVDSVACPAMEQTVVAPRGTRSIIEAFQQQDLQASHGTVACRPRTGGTSSDDNHIIRFVYLLIVYHLPWYLCSGSKSSKKQAHHQGNVSLFV